MTSSICKQPHATAADYRAYQNRLDAAGALRRDDQISARVPAAIADMVKEHQRWLATVWPDRRSTRVEALIDLIRVGRQQCVDTVAAGMLPWMGFPPTPLIKSFLSARLEDCPRALEALERHSYHSAEAHYRAECRNPEHLVITILAAFSGASLDAPLDAGKNWSKFYNTIEEEIKEQWTEVKSS